MGPEQKHDLGSDIDPQTGNFIKKEETIPPDKSLSPRSQDTISEIPIEKRPAPTKETINRLEKFYDQRFPVSPEPRPPLLVFEEATDMLPDVNNASDEDLEKVALAVERRTNMLHGKTKEAIGTMGKEEFMRGLQSEAGRHSEGEIKKRRH